jgi:hypothetical protein
MHWRRMGNGILEDTWTMLNWTGFDELGGKRIVARQPRPVGTRLIAFGARRDRTVPRYETVRKEN